MKNAKVSNLVTPSEHLLSLFFSGLYLSNYDFIEIGKKLNIQTPIKDREAILKTLITDSKEADKIVELKGELLNLINNRIDDYIKLDNNYKNTSIIIKSWIERAKKSKEIIKERI